MSLATSKLWCSYVLTYRFCRHLQPIAQQAPANQHLVAAKHLLQRNVAQILGLPTEEPLDTIEELMHQSGAVMMFHPAKSILQNLLICIMLLPVSMPLSMSFQDVQQMKPSTPSSQRLKVANSKHGLQLGAVQHQRLGKQFSETSFSFLLI